MKQKFFLAMVFTVDSVSLEEAPQSVSGLYHQFPKLRAAARTLVDKRREVVSGARSLYVTVREFAISHNQDSKLDVMGTDNLVNNVAIIIKNQGEFFNSFNKYHLFDFGNNLSEKSHML